MNTFCFYLLETTLHILLKHLVLPESDDLPSITGTVFAFVHSLVLLKHQRIWLSHNVTFIQACCEFK